MSIDTQQFLASHQRNVENFLAIQTQLFSGFEKIVNLNLNTLKSSMDEVANKSQQASQATDVQQVANLAQPSAEKAVAYGKDVYEILSQVQKAITQLTEKQLADNQQQVAEFVEQLAKNAPAGSEGAISLVKSSLVASSNATDSLIKAARQASDLGQANLNAATDAALKTAEQAAEVVEQNVARARK